MYTSWESSEVSVCDSISVSPRAIGGWRWVLIARKYPLLPANGAHASIKLFTYQHTRRRNCITERTIAKTLIRNLQ